ncbi:MAG: diaminopimelate epimerase [bacterium]|nr:diaminopimelate epimerase [bacterium]
MELIRMSAAGNAFYFHLAEIMAENAPALAQAICAGWSDTDQRAAASDGLIFALSDPPTQRMFNPDGSEGMCANGLRCLAHLLERRGHFASGDCIETSDGPKRLRVAADDVEVEMGEARPLPEMPDSLVEPLRIRIAGETLSGYGVFVGNPHYVIFADELLQARVAELGPLLAAHPLFPAGVNVEFAVKRADQIGVRVWERGVGETLSCGTGAVAVAAAAGIAPGETRKLLYPGGELNVRMSNNGSLHLAGAIRCEGCFEYTPDNGHRDAENRAGGPM